MEQIQITINGKEISVNPDITILEAVHQNKIDEIQLSVTISVLNILLPVLMCCRS